MRPLGIVLLVCGALGLVFALSMDTSVSAGSFGRVNNIGLMNDKQNYIIIAAVVLIAGVLMSLLAPRGETVVSASQEPSSGAVAQGPTSRPCPYCAEEIKAEAVKCRYCASDVEPLAARCDFCSRIIAKPVIPCSTASEDQMLKLAPKVKNTRCVQELQQRGYLEGTTEGAA